MEQGARKRKRCDSDSESEHICPDIAAVMRFYPKEEHQRLVNERTIEQIEVPSNTTLYDLPLETLDMILEKSYLHWIFYSSTNQRDEQVIRSLVSVDVCFYRRITKQRFKKRILRFLKDFYGKTKKRYSTVATNRNYLLDNIEPNDELIYLLLSLNCLTEEKSQLIQRHRFNRHKNEELMNIMRYFDETKFKKLIKCLRQRSQKTVARIIENGGVVIKMKVYTNRPNEKWSTSIDAQKLHKTFEDLRNRTKPRSYKADKLISQLKEKGIEILNPHLNRRTVVVWIWCRSQAALQHLHNLYESNQLRDVLFENILLSTPRVIVIDRSQFKKTVVDCPISINFTQRIELVGNEDVYGVTKLRNEIYVLCQTIWSGASHVIRVFENRSKFSLQRKIEIQEVNRPFDIGSSENEDCLYVTDTEEKCVWKIEGETDDEYKIIKWMTTDYLPTTLSVSSDGQLLVVNYLSSILMIYGSDAELIRSIQLPSDIGLLHHAVKTSNGNFIISHYDRVVEEEEEEKEQVEDWMKGGSESNGKNLMENEKKEEQEEEEQRIKEKEDIITRKTKRIDYDTHVSELTSDGQMVLRRFTLSNETQQLIFRNNRLYLSLDSDDQVFLADCDNRRVILLDSDLKWNRILCPTKKYTVETRIYYPFRLCYDEEEKQLIVAGSNSINIYTLNRN